VYKGGEMAARTAPGFTGAELPFVGGRYALTIVTTTDRPSPLDRFAGVIDWLSGTELTQQNVLLYMPRFRVDRSGSLPPALLTDLLAAMDSPASFDGFSDDLILLDIFQRTTVEVDEEGLKAAAATAVTIMPISHPAPPLPRPSQSQSTSLSSSPCATATAA
jgi:serine protease inhibitor